MRMRSALVFYFPLLLRVSGTALHCGERGRTFNVHSKARCGESQLQNILLDKSRVESSEKTVVARLNSGFESISRNAVSATTQHRPSRTRRRPTFYQAFGCEPDSSDILAGCGFAPYAKARACDVKVSKRRIKKRYLCANGRELAVERSRGTRGWA
jgi:hypothetical protein